MEAAPIDAHAEANRLYWETELSVGEIASRLDLSRRALYEAIKPVPAEGRCERCGSQLVFTKRSSRAHGFATCSRCADQGSQGAGRPDGEPWTWSPPARIPGPPAAAPPQPQSIWWLGAAALVGALLGAAATFTLVRRP
jgi:hypothetical protein